jgi:hypothetical protein
MGRSKKVHENNGDRSLFPTRCEMERAKDGSAYGRERPRLWLPRACVRAGRSRPLGAERGNWTRIDIDQHRISNGSETDRDLPLQEPSTRCNVYNLISENERCDETSVKTEHHTGVAAGSLCSTVSRTAVPRIHSDYVGVGPRLSDISISSVCVQRFVLTGHVCDPVPEQISQAAAEALRQAAAELDGGFRLEALPGGTAYPRSTLSMSIQPSS